MTIPTIEIIFEYFDPHIGEVEVHVSCYQEPALDSGGGYQIMEGYYTDSKGNREIVAENGRLAQGIGQIPDLFDQLMTSGEL